MTFAELQKIMEYFTPEDLASEIRIYDCDTRVIHVLNTNNTYVKNTMLLDVIRLRGSELNKA